MSEGSEGPARAVVAVAALSARWLAESARAAGWRVVALDLFGDEDTRAASVAWRCVGDVATMAIDASRLRDALAEAAHRHGAIGWIAGPGLDGDPRLLDAGGTALPRWGMGTDAVTAVRDPRRFFAALDAAGLEHPEVAWRPPSDPHGWLVKRADGSGGWHIRPAVVPEAPAGPLPEGTDPFPGGCYWQRHQAGTPMSVLALADGREAGIVALNRLHVRSRGPRHPCVYLGADGPVDDAALRAEAARALARLVPALGLRGLFSADFLQVDGRSSWLEVNPRPSATMALHDSAWPGGLLAAHVAALDGRLPPAPPSPSQSFGRAFRTGVRTVLADRDWTLDAALAAALSADPAVHDRPLPGTVIRAGEPLCSVSARIDAPPAQAGEAIDAALARAERLALRRLHAVVAWRGDPAAPAIGRSDARDGAPGIRQHSPLSARPETPSP